MVAVSLKKKKKNNKEKGEEEKSKEKRNPAKRPKSPAGKRQSYFQAIKDRRERRREYFIRPPV